MKFNPLGLAVLLMAFAGSALAQNQISGTVKCAKPDTSQSVEVGDKAGHMLIIEKGSCTWSVPLELTGLKSTTMAGADSVDLMGSKAQVRGYDVLTMDNGDKAYVRFQGMGNAKGEEVTGEGTWAFTGGSGKLKGLKGKGTYKTSGAPGGAGESQVEGEYSLPDSSATPKKK